MATQQKKQKKQKQQKQQQAPQQPAVPSLPNPGKFEEIHRMAQDLLSTQDAFDGFKCDMAGMSSKSFQFSHAFQMGQTEEVPKYAFTTVYSDNNPPTAIGKIDSDGKVFGRFIHRIGALNSIATVNINKDFNTYYGADLEYRGSSYTGSLKYDANNTLVAGFMKSITRKWSSGLEYTRSPNQGVNMYALGVRYNRGPHSYVFTGNNFFHLALCYGFKKDNLELASELALMAGRGDLTRLSVGMRYIFRKQMIKLRADTEGSIVGIYEESIMPTVKIIFSSAINYLTNDFKFGIGLQIQR